MLPSWRKRCGQPRYQGYGEGYLSASKRRNQPAIIKVRRRRADAADKSDVHFLILSLQQPGKLVS